MRSILQLISKRQEEFRQNARYAFNLCWEMYPSMLLGVVIMPMIVSLLPAALALAMRNLINSLVDLSTQPHANRETFLVWIWLSFGITLLIAIGQLLNTFLTQSFREKLGIDLTQRIMIHADKIAFAHFEDPAFQDNFGRVKESPADHLLLFVTNIVKIVTNGLQLVTLLVILGLLEPLLLWLVVPLSLPYMGFHYWLSGKRFLVEQSQLKKRRQVEYYFRKLTHSAELAEVRLLGLAPLFLKNVNQFLEDFRRSNLRIFQFDLFGSGLFVSLIVVGTYFILYRVSNNVINGQLSVGDIAVYVSATAMLRMTLNGTMQALGVVQWKLLHVKALRQFMTGYSLIATESPNQATTCPPDHAPRDVQCDAECNPQCNVPSIQAVLQSSADYSVVTGRLLVNVSAPLRGEIEIANLTFTYPGAQQPQLDRLSLHIRAGETVALVGENGVGKTTLVKLLARLYKPERGSITFDGICLNQIPVATLYRQISFVFQNFGQYETTVANNLAYGNWTELLDKPQQIVQLAEQVGIAPLIAQMPDGYETHLGRQFGRYTLSGGQWQQIAIARAFARNAALLILDEPTSNLDALSEYRLFSQFKVLSKGRTTILISHRFSTVSMADRILVMKNGRIIENGTHAELMACQGQYAMLYDLHHRQIQND